ALDLFEADGALALEDDAGGLRQRLDAQIRPVVHVRMDIAARCAPALALVLRHLVDAEPFLIGAVEIVADAELRLARALQKHLLDRIVGAKPRDAQRAALAVILAAELGIALRALEAGQDGGIAPPGVAERGPVIVVGAVAADIHHRVDGAGAAEPLAARLIADAAVQPL